MAMSENQKGMIMRLYPYLTNNEIAEMVGLTAEAVRAFALRNGMIKQNPKPEKTEIERGRHHRYIVCQTPYWELVKQYKAETPLRRFNHPFFESTKKNYNKQNQNGID